MVGFKRDNFTEKTKSVIQNRAGNLCSNPDCKALTSGPNANPEKATKTGEAAHITAAAPGGPRYNANLTREQRKSAQNGIWLCSKCASFIDSDFLNYPVRLLQDWKLNAEVKADEHNKGRTADLPVSMESDKFIEQGWRCPFCGTIVAFGNSVCLGCHAEVIPGLTRNEREEALKTGMVVGGGTSFLILIMLPNWLKSSYSWDVDIFFGLGVYGIFGASILALLGGIYAVKNATKKRLNEPPRFFRQTRG